MPYSASPSIVTRAVRALTGLPVVSATLVTVPAVPASSGLTSCLTRVNEASTVCVRVVLTALGLAGLSSLALAEAAAEPLDVASRKLALLSLLERLSQRLRAARGGGPPEREAAAEPDHQADRPGQEPVAPARPGRRAVVDRDLVTNRSGGFVLHDVAPFAMAGRVRPAPAGRRRAAGAARPARPPRGRG